jgi:hypothetical protein
MPLKRLREFTTTMQLPVRSRTRQALTKAGSARSWTAPAFCHLQEATPFFAKGACHHS